MPITVNDIASIKAVSTVEKLFAVLITLLQSKQIIAGNYDPLKTAVVDNEPVNLNSPSEAADLFGFGSQLHRMAIYSFLAVGGNVPITAFPLPAAIGGAAATKTITFAIDVTTAGTYYIRAGSYLTDDLLTVAAAVGATPTEIAALVAEAVTGLPNLPFTAAAALGVVTLTAKTKDVTTDDLSVTINHKESTKLPGGMTAVVANGIAGTGISVLTGLWSYLDDETTPWYTNIVQPYTDTTLALDGALAAIGNPNDQSGLYDAKDYRPAQSFTVDTTGGSAGLAAAIALGDARKNTDVVNCRAEAPDYPELGFEIACYLSGFIALNAVLKSATGYTKVKLSALFGPLDSAEDWTTKTTDGIKGYDNVNAADRAGITSIIYKNGVAQPGDVTTFWHPDDLQNKPFKYVVNQRKIWNVQNITEIYLNSDSLIDAPIVKNVAAVNQSEGAVDADTLKAGLAQIAGVMERFAWIYSAKFTIQNTTVTENEINPDRFDIVTPIIVSGNNRVNNGEVQVDRNLQAAELRFTT